MDTEPQTVTDFLDEVKEQTGPSLQRFISTKKTCENSYAGYDIGTQLSIFVNQPTQGGKTDGLLYMGITGALDYGMLPIIFTMDRVSAFGGLERAVKDKNLQINTICEMAGIREDNRPSLTVYDCEKANVVNFYVEAAVEWLKKRSNKIPVLAVLPNFPRLTMFVKTVIPKIRDATTARTNSDGEKVAAIRDSKGSLPIFLEIDEADKIFKTCDRSLSTEKLLWGDVDMGDGTPRSSVFEAVSTVAYVTATQSATAANIELCPGRRVVTIRPLLSPLNWQFRRLPGHNNRVIVRKEVIPVDNEKLKEDDVNFVEDYIQVVDDIDKCTEQRVLLIACTKFRGYVNRDKKALALARKYCTLTSGFVVFSWHHDHLLIWTADKIVAAAIEAFITTIKIKVKKRTVGEELREFGVKYSNAYREFLTGINKKLQEAASQPVLKIVLFSSGMVERSVPVKGVDHCLPLTDMFAEGKKHDESMQQGYGRLCGSDVANCRVKLFWAIKPVHDAHVRAFEASDCHAKVLAAGTNLRDALDDDLKELEDVAPGGQYVPKFDFMEHVKCGNSRKRVMDVPMERKEVYKKYASDRNITIEKPLTSEVVVGPTDISEQDMLFVLSTIQAEEGAAGVPAEPVAGMQMGDQVGETFAEPDDTVASFVNEHRKELVEIFREEVHKLPGYQGLTIPDMAKKMAEHSGFPDGCPLNSVQIVRYIESHEFYEDGGLLREALVWKDTNERFQKMLI